MRTERRRSELECFVLGLLWQLGPCSAYDVRRHMQRSPSTQWSGSAGAIYPLVQRLERRGLLKGQARRNGKRSRKDYALTPKGLKVLKEWIGPPLPDEAVTVTYDPLRSRARFLGVMTSAERRQWVEAAAGALEQVAARVAAWRAEYAAGGDPFAAAVSRHGELDTEWRRQWLKGIESNV